MLDKQLPPQVLIMKCDGLARIERTEPAPGYSVSRYRPGDERGWAAIEAAVGQYESEELAEKSFTEQFSNRQADLEERMFLARDAVGNIAATCTAWHDDLGVGPVSFLHWLATHPDHQGKGLARMLMIRCLSYFQEHGERPIYLHTSPQSRLAIPLYLSLGFYAVLTETFSLAENQSAAAIETLRGHMAPDVWKKLAETARD